MYSKDATVHRILNETIAATLATLRHGEIVFIADAGMVTAPRSLSPLPLEIPVVDLGAVTGVPSLAQLLPVLRDCGDFEAAVVASEMRAANPEGRELVETTFGSHVLREVPYVDLYRLRNQAKLFVRTGEFSAHGNVALIGGYPTADVPIDVLVAAGDTSSA